MQAVILAAGSGTRLRDVHTLPKGFLRIGGHALIEHSITHLTHNGITDILIITGYGAEHYTQWVNQFNCITTLYNPFFQTYGNLYSLSLAKDWVKGDVLIVESDIIYEGRALSTLINTPASDAIITSGFTQSGDEVYVSAQNNLLLNMKKNKDRLIPGSIIEEFVGLTKLSFASFQCLIHQLEDNTLLLQQGHYDEDGLVSLSSTCPIACIKLADLLWAEIDNHAHYLRAQRVYSDILKKELA